MRATLRQVHILLVRNCEKELLLIVLQFFVGLTEGERNQKTESALSTNALFMNLQSVTYYNYLHTQPSYHR
jgi:hypothetical protein